jgi:hypothetical protein
LLGVERAHQISKWIVKPEDKVEDKQRLPLKAAASELIGFNWKRRVSSLG